MTLYREKPVVPKQESAFRFGFEPCPPVLEKMLRDRKACAVFNYQVTPHPVLEMEYKEGELLKANRGDWVIFNDSGPYQVLKNHEFIGRFENPGENEVYNQAHSEIMDEARNLLIEIDKETSNAWENIDPVKYQRLLRDGEGCCLVDPNKPGECWCDECCKKHQEKIKAQPVDANGRTSEQYFYNIDREKFKAWDLDQSDECYLIDPDLTPGKCACVSCKQKYGEKNCG